MTDRHRAKERAAVVIWKLNAGLTDVEAVCDLFDAYDVEWELRLNELGSCSFKIPLDDPFLPEIVRFRFVEIWEEERRIELFRIVKTLKVRGSGGDYMAVSCVHVLDTMNDHVMKGLHTATGTAAALAYLIAQQPLAYWALGTNDFARAFTHQWQNYSILRALYSIPGRWGDEDVVIGVNTTTFPWTLSFLTPDDSVTALVQPGRNTQLLERAEDATEIVTRLYAYGSGAGMDQLTIASVNITGNTEAITAPAAVGQKAVTVHVGASFVHGDHVYVSDGTLWENNEVDVVVGNVLTMVSNLLHSYTATGSVSEAEEYIDDAAQWAAGVRITRVWEDQRFDSAVTLKAAADAVLLEKSTPKLTYTGEVEDLARATGLSTPEFQVGKVLRIWDAKLGKNVDARIIVLRRPDVEGKPGEIEIELTNRLDEFPGFGDVAYANNIDDVGDGTVFGRVLSTCIENGRIILAEVIGDLDFANIVNEGDLYEMSRTPGVSSLYLSATYMGYYKSGTGWTSYIKGDGTFKFYGKPGNYIEWDGTTLAVRGALVVGDVSGLGSLATLNTVAAANCDATIISGGKIITGLLTASNIQTGILDAGKITVSNLNADSITAGTLTAVTVRSSAATTRAEMTIAGASQEHVFRIWKAGKVTAYLWSDGIELRNAAGTAFVGGIENVGDAGYIYAQGSGAAIVLNGIGAQATFNQIGATAGVECLSLSQSDTSEGFINFAGADRGCIAHLTDPVHSVRVELNGVVYRLGLYADA